MGVVSGNAGPRPRGSPSRPRRPFFRLLHPLPLQHPVPATSFWPHVSRSSQLTVTPARAEVSAAAAAEPARSAGSSNLRPGLSPPPSRSLGQKLTPPGDPVFGIVVSGQRQAPQSRETAATPPPRPPSARPHPTIASLRPVPGSSNLRRALMASAVQAYSPPPSTTEERTADYGRRSNSASRFPLQASAVQAPAQFPWARWSSTNRSSPAWLRITRQTP